MRSSPASSPTESRSKSSGTGEPGLLKMALANEWSSLYAILTLSIANVVLGVWRPKLYKKPERAPAATLPASGS